MTRTDSAPSRRNAKKQTQAEDITLTAGAVITRADTTAAMAATTKISVPADSVKIPAADTAATADMADTAKAPATAESPAKNKRNRSA